MVKDFSIKQKFKGTLRFYLWRMRNPGKPFHQFYIAHIKRIIGQSQTHPTLGPNYKDYEKFVETAKIEKKFLIENGLLPNHKFADYGCGSLRLGTELIPYLNSGNYFGLDMTDYFFPFGKQLIDAEIWKTKQPILMLINDKSIEEIRKKNIDFLMSCAVLPHIPQPEIPQFFRNILRLIKPEGKAFVDFTMSETITKLSMATWAYPAKLIEGIACREGAIVSLHKLDPKDASWYLPGHTILEIHNQ